MLDVTISTNYNPRPPSIAPSGYLDLCLIMSSNLIMALHQMPLLHGTQPQQHESVQILPDQDFQSRLDLQIPQQQEDPFIESGISAYIQSTQNQCFVGLLRCLEGFKIQTLSHQEIKGVNIETIRIVSFTNHETSSSRYPSVLTHVGNQDISEENIQTTAQRIANQAHAHPFSYAIVDFKPHVSFWNLLQRAEENQESEGENIESAEQIIESKHNSGQASSIISVIASVLLLFIETRGRKLSDPCNTDRDLGDKKVKGYRKIDIHCNNKHKDFLLEQTQCGFSDTFSEVNTFRSLHNELRQFVPVSV